jgi:hypothetical protein
MFNFVQNHWLGILLVLCFLAIMIILWKRGKKDTVKTIIYGLVCQAEQAYGSNTGPIKLASVWVGIYEKLPWYIRLLFPKKQLDKWIVDGVQLLKRQLRGKGFNLLTYNQEVENVIKDKVSYPLK